MHALLICRTCPRDRPDQTKFAERLQASSERGQLAEHFRIAFVECLGSCPAPAAVAFDAPDKWRVRLSRLSPVHLPSLVVAATTYRNSDDGYVADAELPPDLRGRISSRSPKRPSRRDAEPPPANGHSHHQSERQTLR